MSATRLRLTAPAKADYLILTRLLIAGLARTVPIEEQDLADLKLAVTEACGNVVKHAYGPKGGNVVVTAYVDDSGIEIVVEDSGVGTDHARSDRIAPSELPESGMGLTIIRAIADEMTIEAGDRGIGTRVRFHKAIPSVSPVIPG